MFFSQFDMRTPEATKLVNPNPQIINPKLYPVFLTIVEATILKIAPETKIVIIASYPKD